ERGGEGGEGGGTKPHPPAATLTKQLADLTRQLDVQSEERRNAERESANQSAALRQMDSEVQRLERRLQDWTLQNERNKDARSQKQAFIEQKQEEAQKIEAQHQSSEAGIEELQRAVEEQRQAREVLQQQAAQ